MKPLTAEWVRKAEADFATAEREFQVTIEPNWDAVCFHSQQAAEKFLKARLQEATIAFAKIHDLTILLDAVLNVEPTWETLRRPLNILTVYAVEYRYPGESCDQSDASEAIGACRIVRKVIRNSLGLTVT